MTFNTLELIKLSNKNKALAKLLKKRKSCDRATNATVCCPFTNPLPFIEHNIPDAPSGFHKKIDKIGGKR